MASIVQRTLTLPQNAGWGTLWQRARAHVAPALPASAHRPGLALNLAGVSKGFGTRQILRALDLQVEPGEFIAIIGRSGSGKSTLLRLLAGLEQPDEGGVLLGGKTPAQAADELRIMFQDGRLLPWQRVIENVALGLTRQQRPRATAALHAVGLDDRAQDWPQMLSGGQKQRVALARALAANPRLVLLDEPLGALDALTRLDMQGLIERLWQQAGFTAVLVTHDVAEAALLADRILLIEEGGIGLDLRVTLPRPRRAGAALAEIEAQILQRLMRR